MKFGRLTNANKAHLLVKFLKSLHFAMAEELCSEAFLAENLAHLSV